MGTAPSHSPPLAFAAVRLNQSVQISDNNYYLASAFTATFCSHMWQIIIGRVIPDHGTKLWCGTGLHNVAHSFHIAALTLVWWCQAPHPTTHSGKEALCDASFGVKFCCLYSLHKAKFGQLILSKIFKIVASRCQILRYKCTKFHFDWGSSLDRVSGELTAHSVPPDPLAGF